MSERLREQLQDRLLVALDFATLGAYELTGPEGGAAASGEPAAVRELRPEPPKRVFLFAKAVPRCPEHDGPDRPHCDPVAETSLRGARRGRRSRRGGMVRAPEQPCTWP